MKRQITSILLLSGASLLPLSALALSETQDSKAPLTTSYSQRITVFSPETNGYEAWKTWVNAQNQKNPTLRRGDGTSYVGPVGQITVDTGMEASSGSDRASALSIPPDQGPPTPLPATGTPGQKLTIKNQTSTLYQEWSFVWLVGGGGLGAWDQQSYSANTCAPKPGMTGSLCAPSL